ncbi:MAG TPA: TrkH family potassium uptake protein, partial [Polyangiaceae bacterium]|nr:TrkH family potassium uptake protein [Polyangiaceae bacterium]
LSRATNLWRCLMHWIGGMGIVVLFVAVFPQLGVGAKQLFRAEVPGPITEGLRPRIKQTALALWWIYTGLTLACIGLLLLFGMPLFDAICHAMSTLGTGGFSTKTASVGGYAEPGIHWTLCAFMFIAGLNFGLYYGAVRGRWRDLVKNYELRFYLVVNLAIIAILFFAIRDRHPDAVTALRFASFQTTAITSTTGFMTEDFDLYPDVARYTMFLAMFMGGCAGSTAGGIKASRIYILIQAALNELRLTIQPNAVIVVRVGAQALQREILYGVAIFVAAYFFLFALASLCLMALGLDPMSGMSVTVACLSSVGPGLNLAGPTESLDFVPALGKLVLILCMIAGRLEIFALFVVLHPETWRR